MAPYPLLLSLLGLTRCVLGHTVGWRAFEFSQIEPPPPRCVLLAEDALILSLRKAAFHDTRHVLPANVFASFLKVYANRAAYNAADRQELPDELPVGALGGSKGHALVVKVSMRWTTTNFDASSQPFVDDDSQLSTWKLDAAAIAGFGACCPSDKLVSFRRPDAIKVFNFLRDDVIRDGRCGYILGPPGSGKSATAAAFALALARTRWVVTWIHLGCMAPPECVRLERNLKTTLTLGYHYLEGGELGQILSEVDDTENHIVLVDDVALPNDAELLVCKRWLKRNRLKRRLVVVPSVLHHRIDEGTDMDISEMVVSPWTLSEYLGAVEDDELFQHVRPLLDASDGSAAADVDAIEAFGAVTYTDSTNFWRHSLVRSKYYFAGGNARYMSSFPTAKVSSFLDQTVRALSDDLLNACLVEGDDQLTSRIRYIFQPGITSGCHSQTRWSCADKKKLTPILAEEFNAVMQGWVLELRLLAGIRKGGVTLYMYDGGERTLIHWPGGQAQLVDPPKLLKVPASAWLQPQNYYQGSYNAVYIDKKHNLVRFVQVARAHSNTLRIHYLHQFLCHLHDI